MFSNNNAGVQPPTELLRNERESPRFASSAMFGRRGQTWQKVHVVHQLCMWCHDGTKVNFRGSQSFKIVTPVILMADSWRRGFI